MSKNFMKRIGFLIALLSIFPNIRGLFFVLGTTMLFWDHVRAHA